MELAKKMNDALKDVREKRKELEDKPNLIKDILHDGATKARKVAQETIAETRDAMNLKI